MTQGPKDESAPSAGDAASQLQEVVLSLVAAARLALDTVERLAKDPGPLVDAAARAAQTGRQAASTWATAAAGAPRPDVPGAEAGSEPSDDLRPDPPRRPRVEHIRVEPVDD